MHAPKTALEHWQLHARTEFHLRSLSPSLATHMLQAEALRMPSAVAAFGGIDSQSDQTGNQFSERIQGGAPQVEMGNRNPFAVV